jgi:hypothetical protein
MTRGLLEFAYGGFVGAFLILTTRNGFWRASTFSLTRRCARLFVLYG